MGNYSTLKLSVDLKTDDEDKDEELVNVLDFMMSRRTHKNAQTELVEQEGIALDHKLFQTERWARMLHGGMSEFDEMSEPVLTYESVPGTEFDKYIHFSCHFTIKNYDDEIGCFLDYLSNYLYSKDGAVVGFFYYDEWERPTTIAVVDGKLKLTGKDYDEYEQIEKSDPDHEKKAEKDYDEAGKADQNQGKWWKNIWKSLRGKSYDPDS